MVLSRRVGVKGEKQPPIAGGCYGRQWYGKCEERMCRGSGGQAAPTRATGSLVRSFEVARSSLRRPDIISCDSWRVLRYT